MPPGCSDNSNSEDAVPSVPRLCLLGPTAVGKTEIALRVAERLGAEIISVDSMQVYCGLDIGTAKPGAEEKRRVPHHLLDVADLSESFSAADFVRLAQKAETEINARGGVPLFCGGTGMYFNALLHGLGEAPASEPGLRAELESTPLNELLAELAAKDSAAYARIDRHNPRRVIRAVEVVRLSGHSYLHQRANWTSPAGERQKSCIVGLSRTDEDLRCRIDHRVEHMFQRGLVEETERLLGLGLEQNRTALQALGYHQVVEHLQGRASLAETIARVKTRTRRFAKRQMTWFRNKLEVAWIQVAPDEATAETARKVERKFAAWLPS